MNGDIDAILLLSAALLGLAMFALVTGGQAWFVRRWHNDVAWLRDVMWRFKPDPPDPRPYVAMMYGGFIVAFLIFLFVFPLIAAIILWVVLLVIPRQVVAYFWSQRRKKINEQLAPAVLQMSNSVSAGLSLVQAIDRLAERAPEPIRTEFRIMANQWRHGQDLPTTIEEAKRRLDLPNFTLFASTLTINQEMGGNVADTLDQLAHSLEAIEHMQHEVYAATSEGRMNIKVMAFSPIAIVGLLFLMDYEATMMLFTTTLGRMIVGICIFMTLLGTYLAWRIINADV